MADLQSVRTSLAEATARLGSHRPLATFVGDRGPLSLSLVRACLEERVAMAPVHPRWTDSEVRVAEELLRPNLRWADGAWRVEPAPSTVLHGHDASGPEAPAAVLWTSGSSGAPRAAVLSTRALDAAARASAEVLRTTRTDRWLLSLPLAHVGGLSIAYRAWRGAGEVVFGDGAPFEASAFHALLTREAVTVASVVPTMLARLVRASLPSPASLRVLLVGGAAAPDALIAAATELGYPVRATYGLTETAAQLATAPGTAAAARVVPGMEIRAPSGVLEVRGPQLFSGYVGGEPVSPNDWWSTRDAGEVTSDGVVRVLGRVDDVIVSGGENVQPLEVESVLTGCPGVDAVCVVGVPDAEWGERVVGVVAGVALRADLDAFAAARLAAFKCPKHWVHVEAVPVTANGKLDRGVARSLAVAASAEPRPVGDA